MPEVLRWWTKKPVSRTWVLWLQNVLLAPHVQLPGHAFVGPTTVQVRVAHVEHIWNKVATLSGRKESGGGRGMEGRL